MIEKEIIVAEWKRLANSKNVKLYDVAAYAVIKALYAKSNDKVGVAKGLLLKSFTPITNENKLLNGSTPFSTIKYALYHYYNSELFKKLDETQVKEFREIRKVLMKEDFSDPEFCYILARTDIPKIHQLVQVSHATMQVGHLLGKKNYNIKKLHFCVIDGGSASDIQEALRTKNCKALSFYEPDAEKLWGGDPKGEQTAAALLPIRRSVALRKGLFREKKLLEM